MADEDAKVAAPTDTSTTEQQRASRQAAPRRARPQGRRVRRVLRKIDTWSVARMAFFLNACLAIVVLTAGVVLWLGADGQGLVDKLEKTIRTNLQLETFEIHADVLLRGAVLTAVLTAALFTALAVIGALLFNLLSDLVGGVQVWVLEEVIDPQPVYDQESPPTGEIVPPQTGELPLGASITRALGSSPAREAPSRQTVTEAAEPAAATRAPEPEPATA